MTTPLSNKVPVDIATGKCEVTNKIENFMADAFIFESQLVVDDTFFAEHQYVARCDALSNALVPQPLRFLFQYKRSGRCELFLKDVRVDGRLERFTPDGVVRTVI